MIRQLSPSYETGLHQTFPDDQWKYHMSIYGEGGKNRNVRVEKKICSHQMEAMAYLSKQQVSSSVRQESHTYPTESDEGEQCSRRASSMCFIPGSEMTFAERWNRRFLCAVSCLWTLKLPSALPNLNPGIKLPFATTSYLSWQFRQLTTWWSILLSRLCCKMRNWEQFCCALD